MNIPFMKGEKNKKINLILTILCAVVWWLLTIKCMTGWPYGKRSNTDTIIFYLIIALLWTLSSVFRIIEYIKTGKKEKETTQY